MPRNPIGMIVKKQTKIKRHIKPKAPPTLIYPNFFKILGCD